MKALIPVTTATNPADRRRRVSGDCRGSSVPDLRIPMTLQLALVLKMVTIQQAMLIAASSRGSSVPVKNVQYMKPDELRPLHFGSILVLCIEVVQSIPGGHQKRPPLAFALEF